MHNQSNQFIISLSPDTLSAATVRKGQVKQAERIDLDPRDWAAIWEDGFMGLDQPLRQLMSRFSSRSVGHATLIYHSPTVTQQVYTFENDQSAMREVGELKIRESIGYNDPIESYILSGTNKGDHDTTLLVYSEREEQLRSLYAWLNRSGVRVQSLVPASAVTMHAASKVALAAEPDTAVFFLGADVSVMAYASSSGIHLIRSAEIGYRKLIDGYMQALHADSESSSDNEHSDSTNKKTISSVKALRMLLEHGIPVNPVEIDGVDLRTTVLPVLAPVLQRFCIEIKQTFRFGLNGVDIPKNLMLCGPGAAIPFLGKSISQHIDMHVQVDPKGESFLLAEPFGRGTLECSVFESKSNFGGLLPAIALEARMSSKLTRSVIAGAVIAAVAMGAEYGTTTLEYQKLSDEMSQSTHRVSAVQSFNKQIESVARLSSTISEVSELVDETIETIPQWQVLLSSLSETAMDSIRIQEVRGQSSKGTTFIEINGVAVSESEKESGQALNDFFAGLEAIDGVSQVSLGSTSRINVDDDQWGRQFTIKVELERTSLPYKSFVQAPDSNETWGTP
jgi:Tfp pilus assembly PilM family ATPase